MQTHPRRARQSIPAALAKAGPVPTPPPCNYRQSSHPRSSLQTRQRSPAAPPDRSPRHPEWPLLSPAPPREIDSASGSSPHTRSVASTEASSGPPSIPSLPSTPREPSPPAPPLPSPTHPAEVPSAVPPRYTGTAQSNKQIPPPPSHPAE